MDNVRAGASQLVDNSGYKASIALLGAVKSTEHGIRLGYLFHKISDRHFGGGEALRKIIFEDGFKGLVMHCLGSPPRNVPSHNSVNMTPNLTRTVAF